MPSRVPTAHAASPHSPVPTPTPTQRSGLLDPEAPTDQDLDAVAQAPDGDEKLSIIVPISLTDRAVAAAIPAVLAEPGAGSGLSEIGPGVAKLAEEFVAKVIGGSQNPRDPAYQQRWAESQAESDTQMRTRYGGHAWLKHHQEAYRQALGNSPNPMGQGN